MQALYSANLLLHALAGALALLTVAVPVIAKKGGSVHRKVGWVFTVSMAVVAVTGALLTASWLIAPLAVKPLGPEATAEAVARHARSLRLAAPFFGLLTLMTGYAVWGGIASLRRSERRWLSLAFSTSITVVGVVVLVIGLKIDQLVFTIFGAIAAASAANDLRTLAGSRQAAKPGGRERVVRHLQAMLGGATAAATAFTVQVGSRLVDTDVGSLAMWTAPILLGMGTSYLFTRSLRGKRVERARAGA